MKYIFNIVPYPTVVSSQPFKEQSEMMETVIKNKAIIIDVSEHTKQTLSVKVTADEASFLVGYIPDGCENLKFLTQERFNVWSGYRSEANYFKVLKSQGWKEFRFYMEKILDSLHIQAWADHFNVGNIDELEVTVWMKNSIRMRLGEPTIMESLTCTA